MRLELEELESFKVGTVVSEVLGPAMINTFVLTLYYPGRQNRLRPRRMDGHVCSLSRQGHGTSASCLTTALVKHGAWNLRLLQQEMPRQLFNP